MDAIQGFNFQSIHIDRHGKLTSGGHELAAHVKDNAVTDAILLCHGFRNDENDAARLYTKFLETFKTNHTHATLVSRLANRSYAVGGVFWPSMVFQEPNDSGGTALSVGDTTAQDRERLEAMKADLDPATAQKIDDIQAKVNAAPTTLDARLQMASSLIELIRSLPVSDTNEMHAALATVSPGTLCDALTSNQVTVQAVGSGGASVGIPQLGAGVQSAGQAASLLGNVIGFVPKFLNLTTFLLMFHRCGDVGEKGISEVVRLVKAVANPRIHLVGHSLGGRAVTACGKALLSNPVFPVDTMMLLQAAYSHFGLSPAGTFNNISHPRGHFRDAIDKKVVKGPILATHSTHDAVVQFAYTPMAAISGNNAMAIGDSTSPFGGIGRNGVLDAPGTQQLDLKVAGTPYTFTSGTIHNLDGSRDVSGAPLIASHGDVANPAVTWAFASLLASV